MSRPRNSCGHKSQSSSEKTQFQFQFQMHYLPGENCSHWLIIEYFNAQIRNVVFLQILSRKLNVYLFSAKIQINKIPEVMVTPINVHFAQLKLELSAWKVLNILPVSVIMVFGWISPVFLNKIPKC